MRGFHLAFQFLTALPAFRTHEASQSDFHRSLLWFPAVGFLIGALQWGTALILLRSSIPPDVVGALIVILAILVTGGLHIDGVADCADGFGAGHDRSSILKIMKDERIGVFAITAVSLVLYLKILAFTHLLRSDQWLILVFAPAFSRATIAGTCTILPYAREQGTGKLFAGGSFWKHAFLPLFLCALLFIRLQGNLVVLAACFAAWALLCIYYYIRISGYTGDTLGLQNEIVELAAVITAMSNESR